MVVIQVSEIRLVGSVLAASPDTSVIPAQFGAEPLALVPGLLHGIVPVSRMEDMSQVVCNIPFVTVADIAQYAALQLGDASLETGAGKHFADDIIKSLETIRAYESDSRDTSLVDVIEPLFPANGAFRRLVIDAENLTGLVFLDGKDDIESFSMNAALAVNLDMDAVEEHYRTIALQRAFRSLGDITAQIVKHPRYASLAVVLLIDVVEHFSDLFLREAFGVQRAGKTFTLFLLIAQYGQYAGMEVAVSVSWYTEGQCPSMTVCPSGTVAVALVAGYAFFLKIFPAF